MARTAPSCASRKARPLRYGASRADSWQEGLGLQLGPPLPTRQGSGRPAEHQWLSAAHCRRLCQGRAGIVSTAGLSPLSSVHVTSGSWRRAVFSPPCGSVFDYPLVGGIAVVLGGRFSL